MKAKILIDGLNHNGEELKKGKIVDLPWQIVNNWGIRGWVKRGEDDEVQFETDTNANTGTSNTGRSKNSVKNNGK